MRIRALLIVTLTLLIGGPGWASPSEGDDRIRRASTILLASDPTLLEDDQFEVAPWLAENLRLDTRGLKYVGRFGEKGEDRVVVKIRGPIMRKNQFGLMLDIHF